MNIMNQIKGKANAHMMCVDTKSRAGFSLIEMLIAVSIMAIAAVPLAQGLATSTKINAKAANMGTALDISNTILDTSQAIPVHNLMAEINGYNKDKQGNTFFAENSHEGFSFINDALKGYTVHSYNEVIPKYYCAAHDSYFDSERCAVCNAELDVCYQSDSSGANSSIITVEADGKTKTELQKRSSEKYYLMLNDIRTETASFDAIIEISEKRTKQIADISNVLSEDYVTFRIDPNMDNIPKPADWDANSIIKKITVDISLVNAGADVRVLITNDYYKSVDAFTKNAPVLNTDWIQGNVSLNKTVSLDELANGLFLFFPALPDNGMIRNRIMIENSSVMLRNLDFPLYLIPQIDGEKPHVAVEYGDLALIGDYPTIHVASTLPKDKLIFINGNDDSVKNIGIATTPETDYIVNVKIYQHDDKSLITDNGYKYFVPKEKYLYTDMECVTHG